MKRTTLLSLALLGATAVILSGCGGGGSSGSSTIVTPPPPAARIEDSFGTQFGVDFRASPNSAPVKPASGDIIPLSLTTPPKALH